VAYILLVKGRKQSDAGSESMGSVRGRGVLEHLI